MINGLHESILFQEGIVSSGLQGSILRICCLLTLLASVHSWLICRKTIAACMDALIVWLSRMIVFCHSASPFFLFYHTVPAQMRGGYFSFAMEAPACLCAVAEATPRQNGRMKNKNAQVGDMASA